MIARATRLAYRSSPYSEQLAHRLALRLVHAHVERAALPEREPALGAIELRRRDAEIDQEPVDGEDAEVGEHLPCPREGGVDQRHPVAERLQHQARGRQRVPVAVEPDQAAVRRGPFQDGAGVATQADGRVAVATAGPRLQPPEHLLQQDRHMRLLGHRSDHRPSFFPRGPECQVLQAEISK
jgi:hypothetical protein